MKKTKEMHLITGIYASSWEGANYDVAQLKGMTWLTDDDVSKVIRMIEKLSAAHTHYGYK